MKGPDYEHYLIRGVTPKHKADICDRRRRDEREIDALVADAFATCLAVYGPAKAGEDRRTRFARRFYTHLYVKPDLAFGSEAGAKADAKEFIEDVVLAKGNVGQNKLFYLLGEIGVGKTAFINWLITTQFHPLVEKGCLWFLRIDLEDLKRGQIMSPAEVVYYVTEQLFHVVSQHGKIFECAKSQLAELQKAHAVTEGDPCQGQFSLRSRKLSQVVRTIQEKSSRRLLLILDNIDYVCHANDRGLYYDNENTGELHILVKVCDFIELFNPQRELGHLGANVLTVTRSDSYEILEQAMATSCPRAFSARDSQRYVVKSPGAKAAVEARCQLLKGGLAEIPEDAKRKHLEKMPEAIQESLYRGTPDLVTHLLGISNNGLRKMMEFFGQYAWAGGEGGSGEKPRLILSYPLALLAFMLNRKARFSQFLSRFPNIYLVLHLQDPENPLSKRHEHVHTFWLKRMILELLASGTCNDPSAVLAIFGGSRGYEDSIIRECLGSLTDATCSYCVKAERGPHPNFSRKALMVNRIELSYRGQHCLWYLFDGFLYLQLVVEDPLLPIPLCLQQEFDYGVLDLKNIDYGYIVAQGREYAEGVVGMLRIKARQVLLFLEVLQAALSCEVKYRAPVFDRLHRQRIKLPDVDEIRNSVLGDLVALNKYLDRPLDDIAELKGWVESRRDEVRSEVDAAFVEHGFK